jgi:hypothetical protein
MSTTLTNDIRRQVINYLSKEETPAKISSMASYFRETRQNLKTVRDSDVRAVVQPMIVTGKLSYAPGLKIKLGGQ